MQPSAQPETGASVAATRQAELPPEPMGEAAREREEMRMLLMGFGIGLTIGLVFLAYVVMSAAHWFI